VKHAYSKIKAKLRPPNYFEPRGQKFFVVPGIFWFMPRLGHDNNNDNDDDIAGRHRMLPPTTNDHDDREHQGQRAPSCTAPGGTVCTGPDGKTDGPKDYDCSWSLNGTHCLVSPHWLVGKMAVRKISRNRV